MAGSEIYRVHIDVNDHPCFVAPPRWHESTPWQERRRRPLIGNRPEAPLLPHTLGVENHRRPAANFQAINFGQEPAVDELAREFLDTELGEFVAFYPLPPNAQGWWLAQAVAVIDVLDEDHTDWRGEKGRSSVFRYAFRSEVLATMDVDVFVLPQFAYSSWLCTQRFVDRYADSGLLGLTFDRLMRMPGF